MLIYIVSHGEYNFDGEFDCYGVDKAFYNEAEANSYKEKRERETCGEDYRVDELEVE